SGRLERAGIEDRGDRGLGRKAQRRDIQRRLVQVMRRVALKPEEVGALPDNLARTVNAGAFPKAYDPGHPERPFLPADLLAPKGPWVPVRNTTHPDGLGAPEHVRFTNGRSLFLVLLRLPQGRAATEAYLKTLRGGKLPQFPPDTQVALVRRMILIDTT